MKQIRIGHLRSLPFSEIKAMRDFAEQQERYWLEYSKRANGDKEADSFANDYYLAVEWLNELLVEVFDAAVYTVHRKQELTQ